MAEAQLLNQACPLLYRSTVKELNETVILRKEFLKPFQFFRAEWLWHPRRTSDGRGPGLNTTAARVASEYGKGFRSKYLFVDIQTSDWDDVDFYINFILKVILSFEQSGKSLYTGRANDYNIEKAAKGVHLVLSAVISWYNPSRHSVMAQLIEKKLETSMHTEQSSKLKPVETRVAGPVPKATNCIINGGKVIFSIGTRVNRIHLQAADVDLSHNGDSAERLWLEGDTGDERRESLQDKVDRLDAKTRDLFNKLTNLDNTQVPGRIALSRSNSELCQAGMRQQRLLLAQRFDEEVNEDSDHDIAANDLLAYVKTSEEETDRQLDTFRFLEGHSDTGKTVEEAKKALGIDIHHQFPRVPGMAPSSRYLREYQIQGIAWMLKKLSSLQGCLLADQMSLGKTCQATHVLYLLATRQMQSEDGIGKPTSIVCPADLVQEWLKELNELLPDNFAVHVYDSSTKTADILEQDSEILEQDESAPTRVILTTYGVMQRRHGRKRWESDDQSPALYRDWRFCQQGKFGLLIMDEAHSIKGGPKSASWVTITELRADKVLAITGTPVPNHPADVMGIVSAIVRQASLDTLNYQGTVNPFNYPDSHPDIMLQCHVNAIHDWIKNEKNPVTQGTRLRKVFRHILLVRRYASEVNGKKIGDGMPPIKLETVVLRAAEAQDEELKEIMTKLKDSLLAVLRAGPSMLFLPRIVRTASQAGALKKKVVYWVNWPWVQLLTEVVLTACGFAAKAYHAEMSRKERACLIQNFNEQRTPEILVCSYDIGSEGLNLHRQCADVRCLQPATTVARESQAIFRIRRIVQRSEQSCIRVHLRRCMDLSLLFFNLQKDYPQVFAFINEKRESETRLEDNDADLTIEEQSDRTRLFQMVSAGLQNVEEFPEDPASRRSSTSPSGSRDSKRPRTKPELLEQINTEMALFDSLVRLHEDSETVGMATQLEMTQKHDHLKELCAQFTNY